MTNKGSYGVWAKGQQYAAALAFMQGARVVRILRVALMGGVLWSLPACGMMPTHTESTERIVARAMTSVVSLSDGRRGLGSGFVVAGGRVVTNAHLMNAQRLLVVGPDGRSHVLRLIAADDKLDLAVLALDTGAFPTLALRREPVRVGEKVIALGDPFGSGVTATLGIVSAAPRVIGGIERLQTDTAINPGNSGGPLIDAQGRVVGVVNARTAGGQGIGLAIPATRLIKFLNALPER